MICLHGKQSQNLYSFFTYYFCLVLAFNFFFCRYGLDNLKFGKMDVSRYQQVADKLVDKFFNVYLVHRKTEQWPES